MKSLFAAIVMALLLPAASHAQSWQTFKPKDSVFSIELPGAPKLDTPKDHPDRHSAVATMGNNKVFFVMYGDKDETGRDLDEMLDGVTKAMADGKTMLGVSKDEMSGYPARRMKLKDKDGDQFEVRVVIADDRLIQAMYIGPAGDADGQRFLNSFKVTEP